MPRVHIVTDSTADLPAGIVEAEGLDVTVVPLRVHFGNETFRDKIDMTHGQFLDRLVQAAVLPTTAQPPIGEFEETYRRLTADGGAIVSIHISAALSGTFQAAQLAAQNIDPSGSSITVIDSGSASLGLGLLVLTAARLARDGMDAAAIIARVSSMIPRIHLVFTIDTLEFLQRGGRIGRAQAFVGSLLNLKPILKVKQGMVVPVRRERTRTRAIDALVALAAGLGSLEELGIIQIDTPEEAEALADRMAAALSPPFDRSKVLIAEIGPVVGTHVGPRGIGFAACAAQR
jgi:DegV family protein with EDD domain